MNYPSEKPSEIFSVSAEGSEGRDSWNKVDFVRTKIGALILTLIFSACATQKKAVSKMTLEEFTEANPDCERIQEGPDFTVTDSSRCENLYFEAIRKETGNFGFNAPQKPKNWQEGLKHMKPEKPLVGDKDITWWKANMEKQGSESALEYAERIEKLTRHFLYGRLADQNYAASECHGPKDASCLTSVQLTTVALVDVASAFVSQVMQAWKEAGNNSHAEAVHKELGCEVLRLAKFASGLVEVRGGPAPKVEELGEKIKKTLSEAAAKCQK